MPLYSGLGVRQRLNEAALVPEIFQAALLYLVGILGLGDSARHFRHRLLRLAILKN